MTDDSPINPIGTARYQKFEQWMGVPIATSTGKPKWMPQIEKIDALTPYGIFGQYDTEFSFRVAYLKRLDSKEAEIKAALQALSRKYPGQRLVLLCWDDLTKPDGWCHRTMAAEWLEARGLVVPELTFAEHGPHTAVASLNEKTGEVTTERVAGLTPLFDDDFM